MWYNLAASNGDTQASEKRRSIAVKITPAQISEAQSLASKFVASK